MDLQKEETENVSPLRCSTLSDFHALPTDKDRQSFLESVQWLPSKDMIGRKVIFAGSEWRIAGINYLGDYDIEREGGRSRSTCVLGLPSWHPHFASLVDV